MCVCVCVCACMRLCVCVCLSIWNSGYMVTEGDSVNQIKDLARNRCCNPTVTAVTLVARLVADWLRGGGGGECTREHGGSRGVRASLLRREKNLEVR